MSDNHRNANNGVDSVHHPEQKKPRIADPEKQSEAETADELKALREAAAADKAKIQELTALLNGTTALLNGTYFARITTVWQSKVVDYTKDHFNALFREKCPSFLFRIRNKADYANTNTEAQNNSNLAADETQNSRSSLNNAVKKQTWPTDIFGTTDIVSPLAHLVPASSAASTLYDDVARWVFGLKKVEGADDWSLVQKLIHGSRPRQNANGQSTSRIRFTGLKHLVSNKIRLRSQFECYDKNPCVLVIPILTLDKAREWNGEAYDAIVLVDGVKPEIDANVVCQMIGMIHHSDSSATDEELKNAQSLLTAVVLGLGYSLGQKKKGRIGYESRLNKAAKSQLEKIFLSNAAAITEDGMVPVPEPMHGGSGEHLPVRKISFAPAHVTEHPEGDAVHPAPDPLLLTVKAAINWSRQFEFELLAGGEMEDDIDSLDILAEEEYLEARDRALRPKTWEDLALGLHQPNGYQEDDRNSVMTSVGGL